jgi:hypothetical protein
MRIASTKIIGPQRRGPRSRQLTKRTARGQRTQAENGAVSALVHFGGADARRDEDHAPAFARMGPCARASRAGRTVSGRGGGAGWPQGPASTAAHTHHHWGTTATELTFGGRRVQMRRPRVRQTAGGEATLPSVAAFRDRDPLTAGMMQQLLAGVSMRHYEGSLEARPTGRPTRGSSKSAVSRTVVRRTRQRLHEHLTPRLDGLEVVALFMDGVVVAQPRIRRLPSALGLPPRGAVLSSPRKRGMVNF